MKKDVSNSDVKRFEGVCDPGVILMLCYVGGIICLLLFGSVLESRGTETGERIGRDELVPEEIRSGELFVTIDDGTVQRSPLLSQEIEMEISGIINRVKVVQRFVNSSESWVEAIYLFPLPDESSVDHMRLQVGERSIEGQIMEKEKAAKTHERAKRAGRKSSLLKQNRPNIFTAKVANIGPGEEVIVEIEYLQTIRYRDGYFSLRFPMVVGPRYISGTPIKNEIKLAGNGWATSTDIVPDGAELGSPLIINNEAAIPVTLRINLAAGFPLRRLDSLYHLIKSEEVSEGHYQIELIGEVKADRDFVLEWQPEKSGSIQAALFAEKKGDDQYMLLMALPPVGVKESRDIADIPREIVFVLDISGSMAGTSIVQAKKAISVALGTLSERDRFNLIVFNTSARTLFNDSKPGDPNHIARAQKFIDSIAADGGTEMKQALQLALDGSFNHERLRQVVFLTDGAVGNEKELLALIARRLGDSRLFTVGIGSAPNGYFMTRAAGMGRGTHTYIGKGTEVQSKIGQLLEKLERPVVSNVTLTPGIENQGVESYPSPLPDLYLGEPVLISLKTGWENSTLRLTGQMAGKLWETTIDTTTFGQRAGVAALWARKKIRSQMESLALGADEKLVRGVVLGTALDHHLVSRYTSLVAVDNMVSRPPGEHQSEQAVRTHLPQGWQKNALFAGTSQTASPADLRIVVGIVLLLVGVAFAMLKRRIV